MLIQREHSLQIYMRDQATSYVHVKHFYGIG